MAPMVIALNWEYSTEHVGSRQRGDYRLKQHGYRQQHGRRGMLLQVPALNGRALADARSTLDVY